jgi:hypothetical protein
VPNAGFENWVQGGAAYRDPSGWQDLNSQTGLISLYTCTQDSSIAHGGHYSVKLTTKTGAGFVIPGILSTGAIHQSGTIDHGIPISSSPTQLLGWYQYAPVANDTASFSITLYAAGNIVGQGAINITGAASTWTQFTIPVTYSVMANPDSVQLLFFSGTQQASHVGSAVWLDDLSYSFNGAGIAETSVNNISVYPNPAHDQLFFDNQQMQASVMNIYGADGRLVKETYNLSQGVNMLDLSTLNAGFYILNCTGADGRAYRNEIIVAK